MALTETTEFTGSKPQEQSVGFIRLRRIKPMFFSVSSVCSGECIERVRNGFSLIEVLVALAVVAITVSVVLESQLFALKIEEKANILQLFRFDTERICSVTRRAKDERELTQLMATNNLCRIKSEKIQIESGTNKMIFLKHELDSGYEKSFSPLFYLRAPDYVVEADRLDK